MKKELIECACGCGTIIKSKDRYGRDKKFISGHNGRKYDDPTEYKRVWNHRNREQRYAYKKRYIHIKKALLIKSKGGKCMSCHVEYNDKNASMFDFHHRDPSLKVFNVGLKAIMDMSKDKIAEEVKKCDLLCSNCHRLLHSSEY